MCGFAGFVDSPSTLNPEKIIRAMMDTIVHRGPDSKGIYAGDEAVLGFRRLNIIDLSAGGNQPMCNEDRSCVLVFNGEIYNYAELRQELKGKGHRFAGHADSEVIIHGYEEYGIEIITRLRGMFAFAIWDEKRQSLLMARDFFGIKPLYYTKHTQDGSLLFGSEIKSFMAHPAFKKELNKDALKPYLTFQYSVLDETFFKGVYKLKPGHFMLYSQGQCQIKPYAEVKFDIVEETLDSYRKHIQQSMRESVKAHQVSDVKVGSFLSGGVDSSYLTALLMPDETFSIGFESHQNRFNETDLAQELSEQLQIRNYKEMLSAEECFKKLPDIQYHMDEPHANPSCVPLYFLARLASRHVTVVLSGEGADELFGGYDWYESTPLMKKYSRLPFKVRRMTSRFAKGLPGGRLSSFLIRGGQTVEESFIGQAKVWEEADALEVLQDEYKRGPSVHSITGPYYREVEGRDDLTKKQYLDLKLWLPGDILLKADKMSMAHSIELRVPFLDRAVMDLASHLPSDLKVKNGETKRALRSAAKDILPEAWAKRRKVGFPVPIRHWLREEKYYHKLKESFESDAASSFFHTKPLLKRLDDHYHGKANHARELWTVYVYLVWYGEFFGRGRLQADPCAVGDNRERKFF